VDQEGEEVGEIKEVYGVGEDGDPMWVAIETSTGGMAGEDKMVFVPLARIRDDGKEHLSIPYSLGHIQRSPEVEVEDEISEEDDQKLRVYYSIDLADQEFRNEPQSYAAQVPEGHGSAHKITDDLDSKEVAGGAGDDSAEVRSQAGDSDEGDSEDDEAKDRESEGDDAKDSESEDGDSEDGKSDSES
jgi:hypothetical protein